MKSEGSLLCSHEPITSPYPEPDKSSPHSPSLLYQYPCYVCLGLLQVSFSFRLFNQNFECIYSVPHMLHVFQSPSFDHLNNIRLRVKIITMFHPSSCQFISPSPYILLSILFSDTINLYSSIMYEADFHTSKIVVLCVLKFMFLDSNQEDMMSYYVVASFS